jgi:dUTP pyrophosphatase
MPNAARCCGVATVLPAVTSSDTHDGVRVVRNPALDTTAVAGLVDIWTAVSNAGGAVGFVPPVTTADVRPMAEAAFARVAAGVDDLAVAYVAETPVGLGFLATNEWALHRHWGTIRRLQRDPRWRARGVGGALLTELEAAARDRGLERIVLTVRGGTGREGFYLSHGFVLDARLPGRIKVAEGDVREELVLSKVLTRDAHRAAGPVLAVQRLDGELPLPRYAHDGDAGLDLHARVDVELAPGERAVVPTGVAVAVPVGCVGLVHPRSGLAARHGVGLVNAPGTIDAGYRGEVAVVLVNLDRSAPVRLARGERIAQLVIQRVEAVEVVEVAELDATQRGRGGFGSTGR